MGESTKVEHGAQWSGHTRSTTTQFAYGLSDVIGDFMERPPNAQALETTQKIIECGVEQVNPAYWANVIYIYRINPLAGMYLYKQERKWSADRDNKGIYNSAFLAVYRQKL